MSVGNNDKMSTFVIYIFLVIERMGRPYFQFKQFTVFHDHCAMKVGTDGVLLGAWSDVEGTTSVLDIGTGTGLVALMTAQRSQAMITGIDIDADAIEQACENGKRSPWSNRLLFVQADVQAYWPEKHFDAVVCNPPFFENALLSPDKKRAQARHTASLPLERLADVSARLLADDGKLNVILPPDVSEDFIISCWEVGLNLYRRCEVYSKNGKPVKRMLLGLKKGRVDRLANTRLYLVDDAGNRSKTYTELTRDFYLDL